MLKNIVINFTAIVILTVSLWGIYYQRWFILLREVKTRKISDGIQRQERIQSHVDSRCCKITNARSWTELHRKYNAKYTGGESSSACTYIKRHSSSPRDNATMRRGGCLTYVSLTFSHVTLDHRRVNAFSEQHVAPNDTSRLRSFFSSRDYSFPM